MARGCVLLAPALGVTLLLLRRFESTFASLLVRNARKISPKMDEINAKIEDWRYRVGEIADGRGGGREHLGPRVNLIAEQLAGH